MNAHGCELPADGAHLAASSSTAISPGAATCDVSKVVGLHRLANNGCNREPVRSSSTCSASHPVVARFADMGGWDRAAPGVLQLPSGRTVRGRALRTDPATEAEPQFG